MNVILAIVAMSYDEVRLANLANEEEEEAEKKVRSKAETEHWVFWTQVLFEEFFNDKYSDFELHSKWFLFQEEEELREQMIENIIQRSPSEMSNMSYMELYCLDEVARREQDDRVEKVSICSERLDERRPRPRYYSIKKRKVRKMSWWVVC